ncbi:TadE/TadG family type IV pilus assembly protein [Vibrio sp. CUB2]|uniref:TadE/TadG family type IV pilus assembly protein n=1 Tax=Vibrio sp. CUB2 TaxID=2315233 RepID=UPI000769E26A|nr:TadE/TadG family type IV pilus assembly protein [Vibrio sp. CUB2]
MKGPKTQYSSPRKNQGVAAIWFALSLIPVVGMTYFSVEGTRYIQETSRLRDSAQAAALAVTIDDKSHQADALATLYVNAYVRDATHVDITTVRTYEEPTEANDNTEKIQYSVQAVTTHNSWFSNNFIPSFESTENLAGEAIAAKYPFYLGDKIIDLVLVTDFSGSMNNNWQGQVKIDLLKDAVEEIANRILVPREGDTEVLNRIAVIPFNLRVQEKINDNLYATSQLRYKDDYQSSVSPIKYEQVDWSFWSPYSETYVENCAADVTNCPNQLNSESNHAKRVSHVVNFNNNRLEIPEYIGYTKSVNHMFDNKVSNPSFNFHFRSNNNSLYNGSMTMTGNNGFFTIPLTADKTQLEKVQTMNSGGNTAAYQGMLRGLQIMEGGRPNGNDAEETQQYNDRLKMLIVISDGMEFPYTQILPGLVNQGMCDKAREHFQTENGNLYIGVIGVNFSASSQSGFQDCVLNPDEDIIDVTETEDFIKKIEELIKKGSRGNGVSRLYG